MQPEIQTRILSKYRILTKKAFFLTSSFASLRTASPCRRDLSIFEGGSLEHTSDTMHWSQRWRCGYILTGEQEQLNPVGVSWNNQCICIVATQSEVGLWCITMLGSNQAFLERIQAQQEAMGTLLHAALVLLLNCAYPTNYNSHLHMMQEKRKWTIEFLILKGRGQTWLINGLTLAFPSTGIYSCSYRVVIRMLASWSSLLDTLEGSLWLLPFMAISV